MKKILGIIPSVINRRNAINLIIDNDLINFVRKCYPKYEIKILYNTKIRCKLDLIISSGGNTIVTLDKSADNNFRRKLDNYYLNIAIINNISFLGICHGAQHVANYFKSEIIKKLHHTRKNHPIKFFSEKSITVNSYHDYAVIRLGKNLEKIAWTIDGSIEAFKHKKKKILCIMWHPERYKQIKKFDIEFIKKYL
tara:strand:- start:505 stop:1089 length:585 start_codon:yes stop_codon:yes gene_type:complete